ncbi:MAG: hypothetical protein ACRKGH_03800 [Dehalogenimonas sp.]
MTHEIDVDCPNCNSKLNVKVPGAKSETVSAEHNPTTDIAERLAKIESKTQALPEDFCTRFPSLCQDVADIKARQIEQTEATEHAHYAPTEELFDHWLNCPGCKSKADNLAKRLAERSKPEEPVAEAGEPTADTKPERETAPPEPAVNTDEPAPSSDQQETDDEPVWNRVMS